MQTAKPNSQNIPNTYKVEVKNRFDDLKLIGRETEVLQQEIHNIISDEIKRNISTI